MTADPVDATLGELVPAGAGPRALAVAPPRVREQIAGAWLAAQRRLHTRDAYRRDLQDYFRWADEFGIDVLTARRVVIDGYRDHLEHERHLAGSTIARKLAALSSFYRYASREFEDQVARNPVVDVVRPDVDRASTTRHLSLEEVGRLVTAADLLDAAERDEPLYGALVRMLLGCAVRVSELCRARTGDLSVDEDGHGLVVVRKGGRRVRVAVPDEAAAALDRYLDGRTGVLFLSRARPITRRGVDYRLDKAAVVAGLVPPRRKGQRRAPGRRVGPHVLRHTAATLAHRDGADLLDLQRLLGHRRLETTAVYVHALDDLRSSPAHRIGALVEGAAAAVAATHTPDEPNMPVLQDTPDATEHH